MANDIIFPWTYPLPKKKRAARHVMAKGRPEKGTQKHFIREWRKARGLTIAEVADRINLIPSNITPSNISQIETGRSRYSQKSLEDIATVLNCQPWQLLGVNPTDDSWEPFIAARPDAGIEALDEEKKAELSRAVNAYIRFMLDEFARKP